jgi:hypothetical protein
VLKLSKVDQVESVLEREDQMACPMELIRLEKSLTNIKVLGRIPNLQS